MTAKEARERTESTVNVKTSAQYQLIMSKIEKAMKNGEYKCIIYERLLDSVKFQLDRDGYRINEYIATDQRDDDQTTIFW